MSNIKNSIPEVEIVLTLRSSERDTKDLSDITKAVEACLNTSLGFRVLLIDKRISLHQTPEKNLAVVSCTFTS